MQGDSCLTGGLGSVDFDDPAARDSAQAKSDIKTQGSGGNRLDIKLCGGVAELHDRAFAKLFLYL